MRSFLISFLICILMAYTATSQNQILAGQTSGNNIHYTDFEPDYVVDLNDNFSDTVLLDVDNNGTFDLAFTVYVYYHNPYEHTEFRSWLKVLNDNVKVIADASAFHYVKKLNMGDTISANQGWSDADILHFRREYISYWPPPGYTTIYGEFGNGYFGFKIENPGETFYGWIKVNAYFVSVTIQEMAISGETVGVQEHFVIPESSGLFPNPCTDDITLFSDTPIKNHSDYEIVNRYGQVVKTGKLAGMDFQINTADLNPGLYILRVPSTTQNHLLFKFIKQ